MAQAESMALIKAACPWASSEELLLGMRAALLTAAQGPAEKPRVVEADTHWAAPTHALQPQPSTNLAACRASVHTRHSTSPNATRPDQAWPSGMRPPSEFLVLWGKALMAHSASLSGGLIGVSARDGDDE